ncbi:MAG: hypothetical protein IJ222_03295, partial [Bacteroidales bacterium]|nr:hypothetical protein [Bacteroidales bacterium]
MGHPRDWNDIVYRLHGKIYLILGNHDMKNIKGGCMQRFELVTRQMSICVGGQSISLNHNPFLCYGGSYRDVRNSSAMSTVARCRIPGWTTRV